MSNVGFAQSKSGLPEADSCGRPTTEPITATEAAAETRPAPVPPIMKPDMPSLRGNFSALVALVALGSDLY
jgi:hypothetical protein